MTDGRRLGFQWASNCELSSSKLTWQAGKIPMFNFGIHLQEVLFFHCHVSLPDGIFPTKLPGPDDFPFFVGGDMLVSIGGG